MNFFFISRLLQEESRSQSWIEQHYRIVDENHKTNAEIAIFGDSIVKRFKEKGHLDIWKKEVGKQLASGTRRMDYGKVP